MNTMEVSTPLEEEMETTEKVIAPASRKYLIFITDDLRLGVDAEYVVEILNNLSITPLPMTPNYIRGIFNMRGQIIPVLDIRQKLGKETADENLMVVISYDGTQAGVLVDSVDQMLEIPDKNIQPMPSKSPQRLVSGMCSLPDDGGTLLILDCEQLLAHDA